jgi:pimeloyl-ACP methyl ester carboxylesterase
MSHASTTSAWPSRLARLIETVCREARTPVVDVVGHSLGGLVARYLVEIGNERRVRRLVTLGAPYYGERRPAQELAIFAAHDALRAATGPMRGGEPWWWRTAGI